MRPADCRKPLLLGGLLALLPASGLANEVMAENCGIRPSSVPISGDSVRVVSLNVSHGRKKAWNQMLVTRKRTYRNLQEIALFLESTGADVVALQEVDASSRWSGKFDHLQYLLDRTAYSCYVHGRHARTWLYSFGTALLSRSTLEDRRILEFAPSPPTTSKGLVAGTVTLSFDGRTEAVTVISLHLDFSRKKVRDAQIGEVVSYLSETATPLIIMGDLNSQWPSDRSHVRQLAEQFGLTAFEPESDQLGTYKSTAGKRLDWILISSGLEFVNYGVFPDVLSDHLAVFADIRYRGREK